MFEELHTESTNEGIPPQQPQGSGKEADLYNGLHFDGQKAEINFLQRLMNKGEIDGINWSLAHSERLQKLENESKNKEGPGLSEEQMMRRAELMKMQITGGKDWTPELQKELAELHSLAKPHNSIF